MKIKNFSYYLTKFLSKYLPGRIGTSSNTIKSYRDTFSLLLRFCMNEKNISLKKLTLDILTTELINEFLLWIETSRGCNVSTRNQRLSAIHSFFKYLHIEAPEHIFICQQILAISIKKSSNNAIDYLTLDGIRSILNTPDTSKKSGRRDLVLLSLMYDTGARVQEIADLVVSNIRLESPATIKITGKGNKSRIVPLMTPTAKLVNQYLSENGLKNNAHDLQPLFKNRMDKKLTRAGITYILNKYVVIARKKNPELISKKISPHCLRHSKAMHLLQAGVNLVYIRDLLGHVSITTTEIYARTDSELKRKTLEKAYQDIPVSDMPVWQKNHDLLKWLKELGN